MAVEFRRAPLFSPLGQYKFLPEESASHHVIAGNVGKLDTFDFSVKLGYACPTMAIKPNCLEARRLSAKYQEPLRPVGCTAAGTQLMEHDLGMRRPGIAIGRFAQSLAGWLGGKCAELALVRVGGARLVRKRLLGSLTY